MSVTAIKNRIKPTVEDRVLDTFILVFMTVVFFITAYPFYLTVVLSLNDGIDASMGGIYLWPRTFTFSNYMQFLTDSKWILAILVSVSKTLIGTSLCVFFTCLVAYGMSFPNLLFKRFYNTFLLVCMYFSGGLIPYYLTLRGLGMLNTFTVYVIPPMFSIYYCILAISFFRELPAELHESAMLDGANELTIYLRIILPLTKPLLATLALFAAVSQWNAWSDTAFYVTSNKNLRSLAFLMRDVIMKNQVDTSSAAALMQSSKYRTVTSQSVQMAAMVIAVLPIIMVYPFLQKYFVKGIMLGAVKG